MQYLKEGETIQNDLIHVEEKVSCPHFEKISFSNEKRKLCGAIATLTNNRKNGILPLYEEIRKSWTIQHPEEKQAYKEVLVNDIVEDFHPIKFAAIDDEIVREEAFRKMEEVYHLDLVLKDWEEFLFHEIMEKPMLIYEELLWNASNSYATRNANLRK